MHRAGTNPDNPPEPGVDPAPREEMGEKEDPLPQGPFSISLRSLLLLVCLMALIMAAITPWYHAKRVRAAVSRVKADQRSLATAIEAYYIDWMSYPPCGVTDGPARTLPDGTVIPSGWATVHSHLPEGSGARRIFTFAMPTTFSVPHVLTTPVAYITAWPEDLFADTPGATFGYYVPMSFWTDTISGTVHVNRSAPWVLTSFGPDRDENASDGPGDLSAVVEQVVIEDMYRPTPALADLVYDPTNGIWSNGDIARFWNMILE